MFILNEAISMQRADEGETIPGSRLLVEARLIVTFLVSVRSIKRSIVLDHSFDSFSFHLSSR